MLMFAWKHLSLFTGRPTLLTCAVLMLCSMVISTPLTISDPLTDPCTGGLSTIADFKKLVTDMRSNVGELLFAVTKYKAFMLGEDTTFLRVTSSMKGLLDMTPTRVTKFPYGYTGDEKLNVTAALVGNYEHLATVYIFFEQVSRNNEACNIKKPDFSTARTKISNVLSATRTALCQAATYLHSKGTPMPAERIPTKQGTLTGTRPDMQNLELCLNDDHRYAADYIVARDTESTVGKMAVQYSSNLYPSNATV